MKLNIKAFALACGILWGLGLIKQPSYTLDLPRKLNGANSF